MTHKPVLEIVGFTLQAAKLAISAGADRIELCRSRKDAGLTPSKENFLKLRKETKVPIFVMIRPSSEDFMYDEEELIQMKSDIQWFKKAKADGLVFGILDENNQVNVKQCTELVKHSSPLPCTFHRAFDVLKDQKKGLKDIVKCGFTRILTAGGPGGFSPKSLRKVVQLAKGSISILPGGGVRSDNLPELFNIKGLTEFHSSGIMPGKNLPSALEIRKMKRLMVERKRLKNLK